MFLDQKSSVIHLTLEGLPKELWVNFKQRTPGTSPESTIRTTLTPRFSVYLSEILELCTHHGAHTAVNAI